MGCKIDTEKTSLAQPSVCCCTFICFCFVFLRRRCLARQVAAAFTLQFVLQQHYLLRLLQVGSFQLLVLLLHLQQTAKKVQVNTERAVCVSAAVIHGRL